MNGPAHVRRVDGGTTFLVALFLLGLYLGVALMLPGGTPFPSFIAGLAGGLLLLTHRVCMTERHIVAILAVLVLYLLSILGAPDYSLLGEHFKGFIQLSYSLVIGYAFFLALVRYDRRRLAAIFLAFCIAILVGCVLETYTALRDVSDAFRERVFHTGVYVADLRDQILYGRIRPKLFTSEPSAVTFAFALFAFVWYVLSQARGKIVIYLLLLGAAYYFMRGPTLVLAAALIPAYEMLLATRKGLPGGRRMDAGRMIVAAVLALGLALAVVPFLQNFYAERIQQIASGQDPSFFARVIAPPILAFKIIEHYPVAGAGLTGWEYLEDMTQQIYASAEWFSSNYRFQGAANSITNYFWLHWIFLGLLWGTVILIALTIMLKTMGVPSVLFCWIVWAAFGQGAGSYVGPQTWAVLFLAAAAAVVHERESATREARRYLEEAYRRYGMPQLQARREPHLGLPAGMR